VFGCGRIVRFCAVIEPLENPLIAAIAKVVEDLSVAFREVNGAQYEEG
jgi:hypothetical protein